MRNAIEAGTSGGVAGGAVAQEHAMGCAVACVAARAGIAYSEALGLFEQAEYAWTRGYYCDEVVAALAKAGLKYVWEAFEPSRHAGMLEREGTIVFVQPGEAYPAGHYLIRVRREGSLCWMNSWLSFPRIIPMRAGFERELRSRVGFVIHER